MKKILLCTAIILFYSSGVIAQTTKTSASGANNWSNAATWTPNGVPDSVDDVIIPSGSVVTLDQTDARVRTSNFFNFGNIISLF